MQNVAYDTAVFMLYDVKQLMKKVIHTMLHTNTCFETNTCISLHITTGVNIADMSIQTSIFVMLEPYIDWNKI